VEEKEDKLIGTKKVAEMLGVSQDTLRRWDKNGKLLSVRTKGGHRRYLLSEIRKLQGKEDG